jgi:hypothetical protein
VTAQTAADLRAAADVLRRDGWIQRNDHGPHGHCAAGAIEVAIDPNSIETRNEGWDWEQNERFSEATLILARSFNAEVTAWNDTPGRTAAEVIAALEAAAQAAEAKA